STTGANVAGSGTVTTTINDTTDASGTAFDTATWSITGSAAVNEGATASYTVHLDGTLQSGETATTTLAIANLGSTTSADYASFNAAVSAAIGSRAHLEFNTANGTLTVTGTGSPGTGTQTPELVINLAAANDSLVEGPEQYTVALSGPGSTTGANEAGSGTVTPPTFPTPRSSDLAFDTATWSITGS